MVTPSARDAAIIVSSRSPLLAAASAVRWVWHRPVVPVALVLILICYPNTSTSASVTLARPTPADAGAVLLLLLIGLRVFSSETLVRLRSPVLLPLFGVTVAACISTATAADPVMALAGLVRFVELFLLVPIAIVLAVRTRPHVIAVLGVLLGVSLLQGAVGVYQFMTHTGAGFGAVAARAVGTFGIGDQLAMASVVSCGLLAALAAGLCGEGRVRVVGLALSTVLVAPLLMSLSRGSVLAVAVAAVLMAVVAGWRQVLALSAVSIVLVALFAFTGLGSSLVGARLGSLVSASTTPDRSVQDRYGLWSAAEQMWHLNPMTGVGLKNFADFRDSAAPLNLSSGGDAASSKTYVRVQLLSPHNQYLLVLAEQGAMGFVPFVCYLLILVLGPLRRLWHLQKQQSRPATTERVIALALFGLGASYVVEFVYGDISGPSALLLAVLFGLTFAVLRGLDAPQ
ncbi:MAG TPA: O-antigen ligase family protein [Dermatophilaceae bacterium]